MSEPRVLIVAADPLARAGLATLLAEQPGCQVVGQVSTGGDLEQALEVYRPEVVLWDLGWGPAELPDELPGPELPVVALLPDGGQAAAVWAAGARGLLLRDSNGERLAAAVAAVSQGLVVVAPELAQHLLPAAALERPLELEAAELTPREREVLPLLAEGLSNKAIALRLAISEHTVKFHINAIMSKLNAQSRTEAVVRATRLGMIML